jgi:HAE1 family hydrophobic/amphiphilic exporter-1
MRIWLKPDRMLAYKISTDDGSFIKSKFRSLTRENREASGKRSQAFEYVLKYSGRFTTEKQYANIILRSNQTVKS